MWDTGNINQSLVKIYRVVFKRLGEFVSILTATHYQIFEIIPFFVFFSPFSSDASSADPSQLMLLDGCAFC